MKNKTALITGINGQDGSYLAEFLLKKKYEVWGTVKRNSVAENQTSRLNNIFKVVKLEYADLNDLASLIRVIQLSKPDEIYNLAAQSHVRISFDQPIYTAKTSGIGTLNLLEAIKLTDISIKMYQASSSEMFGNSIDHDGFQRESTPLNPVSPYGCAKVFSYNICRNYRNAYNLFVSNGILFNHESPRRGSNFVTNKVVKTAVEIKKGLKEKLVLGNLDATRDWGHAKDYVEAMWLILNKKNPNDYVISTGEQRSVKQFINETAKVLKMKITWKGQGINTKAYDQNNKCIIRCGKKYFRKSEVDELLGDNSKAKKYLKWKPKTNFRQLVKVMALHDLKKESEYNVSQKK